MAAHNTRGIMKESDGATPIQAGTTTMEYIGANTDWFEYGLSKVKSHYTPRSHISFVERLNRGLAQFEMG